MTDIERSELIINGKSEIHHPQPHGFQFLQLLPIHSSNSSNPFSPISPPQAERTSQRMQITASSVENDSIYLCSKESLRTLFFFSNTPTTSCCYCGKPLGCESLVFNRQSHEVSVTISCVGEDSFKWLSSPIMGGSPPKYYVNLR